MAVLIFLIALVVPGATQAAHCCALVSCGCEPYGCLCNVRWKYTAEAVVHLVLKGKHFSKHHCISKAIKISWPLRFYRYDGGYLPSEKRMPCDVLFTWEVAFPHIQFNLGEKQVGRVCSAGGLGGGMVGGCSFVKPAACLQIEIHLQYFKNIQEKRWTDFWPWTVKFLFLWLPLWHKVLLPKLLKVCFWVVCENWVRGGFGMST